MLSPRRLIISDGSLPALAALALQDRPDQAMLWVPRLPDATAARRLQAINRQATHFSIDRIIGPGSAATPPASTARDQPLALAAAQTLLEALLAAVQLRCNGVVWPCQAGLDLERLATLHEVVMSGAHLASLDATGNRLAPEIRTPVLDCTDEQIVELISGSGAPASLAWWCDHDAAQPCGGCDSCRRWDAVRRAACAA